MKTFLNGSLICIAILSSLLSWHQMIFTADSQQSFYSDEVPNVQDSVNLFSKGIFKSDQYDLQYSSGPAVTWPSAIGWNIGKNIFSSRLSCAFFSWIFFLLLSICFFRQQKFSIPLSLACSTTLWALSVTTPFALPYWFGFMQNLGELNSFLLIFLGLVLQSRFPKASVFIFASAIWLGKIIYTPLVLALILGNLFAERLTTMRTIKKILSYSVIFFLPLLLWIAWIYLKLGYTGAHTWIESESSWFLFMAKLHPVFSKAHFSFTDLSGRFSSPSLEWVRDSFGTKTKDLSLSVGAIVFTWLSLVVGKHNNWDISDRAKWISIFTAISVGIYSIHFFFFHPFMWARHFQPAIYTGTALWVFWLVQWIKNSKWGIKPMFITFLIFTVAIQIHAATKHPLQFQSISYARSCANLTNPQCEPR